ncbi:hypothetical protein HZ326_23965 [Fusarium oxysporum f. sp. albedinis]|nr:hypothetical protein HZ326_23965 [Fusarium oxysporum f. sp. albedinis]
MVIVASWCCIVDTSHPFDGTKWLNTVGETQKSCSWYGLIGSFRGCSSNQGPTKGSRSTTTCDALLKINSVVRALQRLRCRLY